MGEDDPGRVQAKVCSCTVFFHSMNLVFLGEDTGMFCKVSFDDIS